MLIRDSADTEIPFTEQLRRSGILPRMLQRPALLNIAAIAFWKTLLQIKRYINNFQVPKVRKLYPEVPGMADYCVYWFRRTHDELAECTEQAPFAGRAGLVGTQNIRNNASREGGLDYICSTGTVIEAVDNQPWSGEANVHVSIANWIKSRDEKLIPEKKRFWLKVAHVPTAQRRLKGSGSAAKEYELECREVSKINSALSDQADVAGAVVLTVNSGVCYTGQYPRHKGFMLTETAAQSMLAAKANSREVVWPFLVGEELLTSGKPQRWVIDFQARTIIDAMGYKKPFAHLQREVLPYITSLAESEREKTGKKTGQDQNWLQTWWRHFRSRPELIGNVSKLKRYLACSRVTKRPIFVFVSSKIRPGDALTCFTLDDDYSFGILQSSAHWQWFIAKCSKMKSDFRYTPESVFDTFPWPQTPKVSHIDAIATAGRELRKLRDTSLLNMTGGLRALYRTLDLPGKNPLRDAHVALDAAVLDTYGFSSKLDLLEQILELNRNVAQRIQAGETVTAPGIPAVYTDPTKLASEDCIGRLVETTTGKE